MFIPAGELFRISRRVWMGRAIGIPFQGDRRDTDRWEFGEPLFQVVVLALTVDQSDPPAVIVDRDIDVIGVLECCRAAIERGVVEVPLRRGELPDELGEFVTVSLVAGASP